MILKAKIDNVLQFAVVDDNTIAITSLGDNVIRFYKLDKQGIDKELNMAEKLVNHIYAESRCLYCTTKSGVHPDWSYNVNVVNLMPDQLDRVILKNRSLLTRNKFNDILVSHLIGDDEKIGLLSLSESVLKWEVNIGQGQLRFFGENLLLTNRYPNYWEIQAYSNLNGGLMWSKDFSLNFDADSRPSNNWWVYENFILIPLKDDSRILRLNIETGELISIIESDTLNKNGQYLMDDENGRLVKLFRNSYYEIDIATEAISHWDVSELLELNAVNTLYQTSDKHCIYFINSAKDTLFAFNMKDRKIIWKHKMTNDLESNEQFVNLWMEISRTDEFLFAKTNLKSLHVFKVEF